MSMFAGLVTDSDEETVDMVGVQNAISPLETEEMEPSFPDHEVDLAEEEAEIEVEKKKILSRKQQRALVAAQALEERRHILDQAVESGAYSFIFRKAGESIITLLDCIRGFVPHAQIDVGQDGMRLDAMDSSHVCLVTMVTKPGYFDYFRASRQTDLCIDINDMHSKLRSFKNSVMEFWRVFDKEELIVKVRGPSTTYDFVFPLFDIDVENMRLPALEYALDATMPTRQFRQIVTTAAQMGDTLQLAFEPKRAGFLAKGEMGSVLAEVEVDEDSGFQYRMQTHPGGSVTPCCGDGSPTTLTCSFLTTFAKAGTLCDVVRIQQSEPNSPFSFIFSLSESSSSMGDTSSLTYSIAPRL